MSEACGFNVYNTEPVKQAFGFGVDGKSGQQIAQCWMHAIYHMLMEVP